MSFFQAKRFLEKLREKKRHAWIWDSKQGKWVRAERIYPGMTLLLHCSDGGYSVKYGFTGELADQPGEVAQPNIIELDQDNSDPLTQTGQYITLAQHSHDVAAAVQQLCQQFSDYGLPPTDLLTDAGRWHDLGKAHAAFQEMLTRDRPDKTRGGPWAKSDHRTRMRERPGFLHELVSALVALHQKQPFLLAYLVAAHHGKVRMSIQPRHTEKVPEHVTRYALGVWEGDDCLLPVDLGDDVKSSAQEISLACMELGQGDHGESWTAQAIALLDTYGPFRLAFLETLIRLADWRVSANANQTDT